MLKGFLGKGDPGRRRKPISVSASHAISIGRLMLYMVTLRMFDKGQTDTPHNDKRTRHHRSTHHKHSQADVVRKLTRAAWDNRI